MIVIPRANFATTKSMEFSGNLIGGDWVAVICPANTVDNADKGAVRVKAQALRSTTCCVTIATTFDGTQ